MFQPGALGGDFGAPHLTDLDAMLLADGETLAPERAAHWDACAACAARVQAFQWEAESLTRVFALSDDDLVVLREAQLPVALERLAGNAATWTSGAMSVERLLWAWIPTTLLLGAVYLIWQVIRPFVADLVGAARAAGLVPVMGGLVVRATIEGATQAWSALTWASPVLDAPALSALMLVMVLCAVLAVAPRSLGRVAAS